jgi:hypothetical protein
MSNLTDRIQNDGVGMRWLRTAATTITSVAAAIVVVWAAVAWLLGPRVVGWAEDLAQQANENVRAELRQTSEHLARLDNVVERLEETTARLAEASNFNTAPSWRFDPVETTISDGEIGGEVTVTATGYKLRDCGRPVVDLYFVNGRGVFHRFTDTSLLTPDGRGIAAPVDPTRPFTISYTAVIPSDDGVTLGRALGYISVTYPDACPAVNPAVAGPLQFRITG